MTFSAQTLSSAACHVLNTPKADEKCRLTFLYAKHWAEKSISEIGQMDPSDHPARPKKPALLDPREMPRRRPGSLKGRMALVHAIAHIELNAIDLAWDIIARFCHEDLPIAFYDDWVKVAYDEAVHFELLNNRLSDFDGTYGDFPAHDGLWDAAYKTRHDLMARLALVPMVLEPRGLDTTPKTVERLRALDDHESADIMERIGHEEIDHVAAGTRWFEYMAQKRGLDPIETYHDLVRTLFIGALKPPFNESARTQAGMSPGYYTPLAKKEGAA